jgi:hypothetical protein
MRILIPQRPRRQEIFTGCLYRFCWASLVTFQNVLLGFAPILLMSHSRFRNAFVRIGLRISDYGMWIRMRRRFFGSIISLRFLCIMLINTVLAKLSTWPSIKSILGVIDLYHTSMSLSDGRSTCHSMSMPLIRLLHRLQGHRFEAV